MFITQEPYLVILSKTSADKRFSYIWFSVTLAIMSLETTQSKTSVQSNSL